VSASERYTPVAIALHWLIAALVLFQFAWGWWMQDIPKQPVGPRVDAFNLHKSIGITLFALMALRILWRLAHRPPPLPPMPSWQARLAHGNHVALYGLLVAQPLIGYLGSEFSGFPVKLWGVTLPGWAGKNVAAKDWLSGAHLVVSWVILLCVLLHVAGALKHALVDRDGLLARMGVGRA
jgi:cytochrome b561